MKMNKKASIQLSINFIVTIIIAIVILGSGLAIVKNFFFQAGQEQEEMSRQLQEQIINSLRGDNPVSIPYNTITIDYKHNKQVGVGILNILNGNKKFKIDVKDPSQKLKIIYVNENKDIAISKGQIHIESVLIAVPKEIQQGQYDINVKVQYYEGTQLKDYLTRKIYVTVK